MKLCLLDSLPTTVLSGGLARPGSMSGTSVIPITAGATAAPAQVRAPENGLSG